MSSGPQLFPSESVYPMSVPSSSRTSILNVTTCPIRSNAPSSTLCECSIRTPVTSSPVFLLMRNIDHLRLCLAQLISVGDPAWLYPALLKLEQMGWISAKWGKQAPDG